MKKYLPILFALLFAINAFGQIKFVDRDSIPYGGNFEGVDFGDVEFLDIDSKQPARGLQRLLGQLRLRHRRHHVKVLMHLPQHAEGF